jgi:hypothetical protein
MAGVLAASAALVGIWATAAPHSWYTTFPGFGHHWVAQAGPYDEHLVRDVGGLYLALLVVTVCCLIHRNGDLMRLTGLAWIAFSLPHLLFHVHHLDGFSTSDKVGNVVALGGTLLFAVLLTTPTRGSARST